MKYPIVHGNDLTAQPCAQRRMSFYLHTTYTGCCDARDYARAQKCDCFDSKLGCVVVESYAAENKSVVCMGLYGSWR